jgi:outer membrane protein OmpA-like peptidoglycan-associated protein
MRYIRRAIYASSVGIAVVACGASPAEADCADLLQRFNAAIAREAVAEAIALETQIGGDAVCGGRLVDVQRRRAALQLKLAQPLLAPGAPSAQAERLLLQADEPEVLWQAAKAVGDMRFSQHRFADATAAFERALEIIKNPAKTPRAPDSSMTSQIFDRATRSRILAASSEDRQRAAIYVPAAKDHRDGSPGGAFSADIRGFEPTVVPLPIQFETASAVLSPIGQKAASELLEALRSQHPAQLTIVGHADERGGEEYNLRLSESRVKAVKKFLQDGGITAQITTIAKGKRDPLKVDGLSDLSREEMWALNRRVEWRRE